MEKHHDWFLQAIIDSLEEQNFDLNSSDKLEGIVSTVMKESLPEFSNMILDELRANAGEMLQEHALIRQEFEARLHRRWAKAFNKLEMLIVISEESAETLFSDDDFVAYYESSYLCRVLTNIHARAVQISYEILCLFRGGFPDGALARWRTLYEIAVVAIFLRKHGEEVAERYYYYSAIEDYNEMRSYQLHCDRLGYEALKPEEICAVEDGKKTALEKYGDDFGKPMGWAIAVLGKKKISLKDLEDKIDLAHWRPYFKLACNFVHSGPKGAYFKMGLIENRKPEGLMVCGPSNYGLADPGQNTSISLNQITSCLLSLQPNFERNTTMNIMNILSKEICDSFIKVQKEIEKEEKNKIRKFRIMK